MNHFFVFILYSFYYCRTSRYAQSTVLLLSDDVVSNVCGGWWCFHLLFSIHHTLIATYQSSICWRFYEMLPNLRLLYNRFRHGYYSRRNQKLNTLLSKKQNLLWFMNRFFTIFVIFLMPKIIYALNFKLQAICLLDQNCNAVDR